ncbi:MAG TPA: hypothetical protein VIK35_00545 [Verrucomicrobiae bacterium]
MNEKNPTPLQAADPVQEKNPVQAAPPPAARLVVNGEKSEREIELEGLLADTEQKISAAERRAIEAESIAAETERENQTLKEIPAPPKPPKVKREKHWSDPVFSLDE